MTPPVLPPIQTWRHHAVHTQDVWYGSGCDRPRRPGCACLRGCGADPVATAQGRDGRTRGALHCRSHQGGAYKDLVGFDFMASEINEAMRRQLHKCAFLDGAENVVLIGGPGTAKTHAATALGIQAVEHHRRKARFLSTIERLNALAQEKTKGKAGQIAESLTRLDLPSSGNRSPGSFSHPRQPRRVGLPAVQRLRRWLTLPSAEQAL